MATPRFTFCIPNLNKLEFLPACIEGVLQQDCPDWQCVFVDGYSTDGSWEYMQQFAGDPRFNLMRGLRQGMYADWNECLRHVETDYFYFLTSDDTCFPGLVSKTVAALDAYPNLQACHFLYSFIDAEGQTTHPPEQVVRSNFEIYLEPNRSAHIRSGLCEFMLHFAFRSVYKTMTSLVMRRSLIDTMGGFSRDYGSIGDLDWNMRLCLETDILFIPELLATWRLYEGQATQLVDLLSISRKNLMVAEKNFKSLVHSSRHQGIMNEQDQAYVLSQLQDAYFSAFSQALTKGRMEVAWQELLRLSPMDYSRYLCKKLVHFISRKSIFAYRQNEVFAHELIQSYGLQWPPSAIASQVQLEPIHLTP